MPGSDQRTFVVDGRLEVTSFLRQDGGKVRGLLEGEVRVEYDCSKYAMKETPETRAMISTLWEERTSKNSRTYNQSKFRLAGHSFQEDGQVGRLQVGLTDYKDHMGTNVSPHVDKYVGEGEDRFSMMSQCVGVGVWAVTKDQKVVLMERAAWCAEGSCLVDRPGGHAEPDDALEQLPGEEKKQQQLSKLSEQQVVAELFLCIRRELRDEVNIALEYQADPELVGVVMNLERGGRCSLDYLIMLDIDSERVLELYKEGGPESDESTNLFLVDVKEMLEEKMDKDILDRFTPHATGSIELLKRRLKPQ